MTDIVWSNVTVTLGQLQPWERNPKSISKAHAKRLLASWDKFGQFQTVAIGPGNEVYDGHQRLSVLRAAYGDGYSVAARQSSRELTDSERRELVIAAHVGTTGQFNWDELANWDAAELQEWGLDGETLQDWKTGIGALTELIEAAKPEPDEDPGAQIDKADELREKWGVESGQMWRLGGHRIICGDCTDKAVVERVMGGEKAQALIVDPPFAVRDDDWDKFGDEEGFISFTEKWMSIGKQYVDSVITFMADKNVPLLRVAAERVDIPYRRALIWRKPPGSQFAGASLDGFWFDFEIIQVFGAPSFKPRKDTQMAVLEYRTVTGQEHGCEKPIGLLDDLVNGYSERGENVVDFFNGTGTVLLSCERTGRKCRSIEKQEKFVAVTLERWVDMTGGTPELITDEQ